MCSEPKDPAANSLLVALDADEKPSRWRCQSLGWSGCVASIIGIIVAAVAVVVVGAVLMEGRRAKSTP